MNINNNSIMANNTNNSNSNNLFINGTNSLGNQLASLPNNTGI